MIASYHARLEATRLFRLCRVNGALEEERGREVVRRIVAAKPRGYPLLLSAFRRLVRLDMAQHSALIESAAPLSGDQQAKVQAGLKYTYGALLSTSFSENSNLIGGMRIRVGSDVYDGSVRTRLAELERTFEVIG